MKIVIKDTEKTKLDIIKLGMNMRQFAERLEIGQSYLSNILQGKRSPSPALAKRIADEIRKPIQEVFDFEWVWTPDLRKLLERIWKTIIRWSELCVRKLLREEWNN